MDKHEITLVTAAKSGDVKCFEMLYELYYKKVFAVIKTTVKNSADAEDVLQQTFLSAWRNIGNISDPSAFNTWIQRIAINQSYSLLRKKNIAILIDSENEIENIGLEESEELVPAVYAEREDLRVRLGRILDNLSEAQRQTISLYYFNELKVEEIAEIMECNTNTIKTRLFLARKAIRNEIEEHEHKTGEKFYGVAGIPLLDLSDLIVQQAEIASLPSTASNVIMQQISSTITAEAMAIAQANGALSTSVDSSVAVGTTVTEAGAATTGAGMTLATKIIIGVGAIATITAGAIVIPWMIDMPREERTPPAVTETVEKPEEKLAEEMPAEKSYYDSLSTEQKQMLFRLESALRASDYNTAYNVQRSAEFIALCDAIPDKEYDHSFTYYPDDETIVKVYRWQSEGYPTYEVSLFLGKDGNGSFRLGKKYTGGAWGNQYVFHETDYSGGKANGRFIYYTLLEGSTEFYLTQGNLRNGKAEAPVHHNWNGIPSEQNDNLEQHSWWPEWPERNL